MLHKIRNSIAANIGGGGDVVAAITNDENKENENNQQPLTSQAIVEVEDNQSLTKKLSLLSIDPPKLSVSTDDKSIDSNEGLESFPSCNITANTSRDYIESKLCEISPDSSCISSSKSSKSTQQQPRLRRALGDISNQKASSQSKKSISKKGRETRRTVRCH